MENPNRTKNICPNHSEEPLNMLCNSCNALICARCIRQHISHLVIHVSEMSQIIDEYLKEKKKPLEETNLKLKSLKEGFDKLSLEEKNLNEGFLKETGNIVENIDNTLKATIIEQFNCLLMKDQVNKYNKDLNDQFQVNEIQLSKLKLLNSSLEEEIKLKNYANLCIKKAELTKSVCTPVECQQLENYLKEATTKIDTEYASVSKYKEKIDNLSNDLILKLKELNIEIEPQLNEGQKASILYYDYDDEDNIIYICDIENLNFKKAKSNLALPAYSSFCQINNDLHILGGVDKKSKKELKSHFFYTYNNELISLLTPMLSPKKDHTAIALEKDSLIVVGGYRNKGLLSECERYFTKEDKWVQMPNLNEAKQEVSLCTFLNWVYTFGGILSSVQNKSFKLETPSANYIIERLNLTNPQAKWEICTIKYSNPEISLKSVNLTSTFALNDKEIIIIGGNEFCKDERNQILVYDVLKGDIKSYEKELEKSDTFNQVISSPIFFNDGLYIMGFDDDLHFLSFQKKEIKLIKKSTWQKLDESTPEK